MLGDCEGRDGRKGRRLRYEYNDLQLDNSSPA